MNDRPEYGVIMKKGDGDGQGCSKGHAISYEFISDNKYHEKFPFSKNDF
jgi:hypothetical protein